MAERAVATTKAPEAKQTCSNSCKQNVGFNSSESTAEMILQLQRTAGNRAIRKLIKSGALQAKHRISQPNEIYEQDVAKIDSVIDGNSKASAVTRLMEGIFGLSFKDIIIRTDEAAASHANILGAKAYTDGKEIGFARDQFVPERREGLHTIAHEFAHVAQTRGGNGWGIGSGVVELAWGGIRTKQSSLIKDMDIIEANADTAADAVIKGKRPDVLHASLMSVALDGKRPKIKVPPRGSFFVAKIQGEDYRYTFNGEDALSWKDRGLTVFTYYLKDTFPDATDQMAAVLATKLQFELTGGVPDETIRQKKIMLVDVPADVHQKITHVVVREYPQLKPARPQVGQRSLSREGSSGNIVGQTEPQKESKKVKHPASVKDEGVKEKLLTPEEEKLAAQLVELMKGAKAESKVDTKEMVRLYKLLKEVSKDPKFGETGKDFVRLAKFFEENKDKIEGILEIGPKGKLTQDKIESIISEYEKFIAAEPIELEPGDKLETVEDYEKEFKYDPGWQQLSKEDRKLLIDYAKLNPEDITDKKVNFKRVTTQIKVTIALKLADKSTLGAVADAAGQAFSDPTFIITLIVMMGIYVGLWLTPDPSLITKLAAGALTVSLLLQFAWEDIIGTARAWLALEKECGRATHVMQLREAGDKFITKLGQTGFDILMFIVMWRVGKRVGPKVQKIGAKRGVARAETKLAEAEAQPGSGKTPKASTTTANLLNEAKANALDPANPTSVLDALAKSLSNEAQTGLARLRTKAGDAQALKAIESQSTRGLDIEHFLTEKGLSEASAKAARAEVEKARVALARAKLIEAETIKNPALREAARAEQYNVLIQVLKNLGILKDNKVQSALNNRNLNNLISAIGEAIGRTKLQTKYPASKGYKVLTNIAVVKELKGFKRIAEWRATEKARAKVEPGSDAALKLEKQLSRKAAKLFEKDGKVFESIGEIDIMVTEFVKCGKSRPVEISEVKTGGTDTATQAVMQLEQSTQGLGQIAAKESGVRLFERPRHNEIGKDLTGEFDLSQLPSLKKTTLGLEGKTGFSETLGIAEEVIVGLAESLIKSLPSKGPHPSLPPTTKKKKLE
jgi:hypothetical protein